MNWIQKYHADFLNGEGLREVIFLAGCEHKCEGCFNPETWSFKQGYLWLQKDTEDLLEELNKNYIQGVTFTGGDPLYTLDISFLRDLYTLSFNKDNKRNFDIWVYSGFTFEEIYNSKRRPFLDYIDVLCDGLFIKEFHKNNPKKWVGSSNQRVIDIKKSLIEGKIIEINNLYKTGVKQDFSKNYSCGD